MTKEEEILAAAEEEFFRNGYDGASTAVIAKAAGVTHAMVNYYFRSKENLFMKILDDHVRDLLDALRPLMKEEGDASKVVENAALAIFDRMDRDRKFPFILQDIARFHPEFLQRYKEVIFSTCLPAVRNHKARFENFHDLCDTIFTLSTAPFLNIAILLNVANVSQDSIDKYIAGRREEMLRIIRESYLKKI